MFARFSRFLTIPALNDEDHMRVVVLLRAIIFSGTAVVIFSLLVRIAVAPDTLKYPWQHGITLGILAGLWLLTRRGYVSAVSTGLAVGMWIMVTTSVLNYGTGIFAPSYVYYAVILVITGLTLGARKAALLAALTILTGAYMAWIGASGNLITSNGASLAFLLWVNTSLVFALIIFLTGLANRGIVKALERVRLSEAILEEQNTQLKVKNESLAAINAIAATLHGSLDFKTVAERALSEIQTYTRAVGSALYYIDDPSGEMRLLTYNYLFQGLAIQSMDDQEGRLSAAAVREKHLLVSEDIINDPRVSNPAVRQAFIDNGIVSGAAIPLILHEKVMGAVGLSFTEKRQLSAEEQATLLSIGNTIALAIDNARRVTQIETEIAERLRAETAQQVAEDKYRSIVENAVEGIVQTTLEGRILMANPAFAHMLGYDSPQALINEIIDMGQQIYVDPEERQALIRQYDLDSEVRGYECQYCRRDGSIIWVALNSRSVRNESGQFLYFEAMVEDITQRKRNEEALRESEERFRVISSITSDYTFTVRMDANGKQEYTMLTGAFEAITGYTPEEFLATGDWRNTMLHPDDRELDDRRRAALNQNQRVVDELRIIHKNGQVRYIRNYLIPILDDTNRKLVGVHGAAQDITERKLAEEALRESEERFRLISSVTTDYTYSSHIDEQGELEQGLLTGALEAITGYTPEEFIAQGGWRPMLHPEEKENDARNLEALKQNQRVDFETRIIRKDGDIRYVRVYGIPVWDDEAQKLIGINGAVQDITQRKLAEKALRQTNLRLEASNDTLRRLIQQLPIGVQIFDTNGLCTDVNETYLDIFRVGNRDQVVGKFNLLEHMGDNAVDLVVKTAFRKVLAGEMVHLGELQMDYTFADRRFSFRTDALTLEVHFCPIYDEHHNITSIVALNHNITEIRQAQARQLELAVAIERARVDVLKEFLDSATHDLRTPLTTMNTSIYLLRRTAESEKQIQYIDRLEAQTQHIHQLIESLFRLSRLDMAVAEFAFAACDLNLLIERIVAQHRPLAESKGHALTLEHAAQGLSVQAEASELLEALKHIVTNACNYTPDGGQITIRVDSEDGQAVVEVMDNGIGIDETDLSLIFERFYRADKARQVTTGAAGLGLTIARKIVAAHHGRIAVESRPGEGSTFRVYLPRS